MPSLTVHWGMATPEQHTLHRLPDDCESPSGSLRGRFLLTMLSPARRSAMPGARAATTPRRLEDLAGVGPGCTLSAGDGSVILASIVIPPIEAIERGTFEGKGLRR